MQKSITLTSPMRETLVRFSRVDILTSLLIFGSIICTAEIGYVLSGVEHISNVIVWAPSGIALGAALMRGRKSFLPIALAFLTIHIARESNDIVPLIISCTTQTLIPFVARDILLRLGFSGTLHNLRDTISFVAVAVCASACNALGAVTTAALTTSNEHMLTYMCMSWIGNLLGIMVIVPVVITWFPWRGLSLGTTSERFEAASVLAGILGLSYFVFWHAVSLAFSFSLLLVLMIALFWVSLRLNVRKVVLATLLITVFGILGSLVSSYGISAVLTQRLVALELFVVLTTPIFLSLATLERERKKASQALSDQAQLLDSAIVKLRSEDEMKNEFLAILAHELRNPLATILNTIELVDGQKANTKEIPLLLNIVEQEVRSMASLLDDLLNVSRITRNKFQLHTQHIELRPILEKSLTAIKALSRARERTLTLVEPIPHIEITADPIRLEQILINVINNAIKYGDAQGPIELSATLEDEHAVIRIRMRGLGIPEYIMALIFEPFFRIHPTDTTQGSLGIGLARTQQLVELHGGTIEARNAVPTGGSEFTIRLPLTQHRSFTRAPVRTQKIQLPKAVLGSGDSLKILVVDDNDVAANALGQLLALRGYTIAVAYNAAQAFEQALEFKPNVAILDIGMPDLDGYEIVGLLREEKLPCVYIALTGYGQMHDKKRALAAGFDHHLTKPTGLKEIEQILKKVEREQLKQDALTKHNTALPFESEPPR